MYFKSFDIQIVHPGDWLDLLGCERLNPLEDPARNVVRRGPGRLADTEKVGGWEDKTAESHWPRVLYDEAVEEQGAAHASCHSQGAQQGEEERAEEISWTNICNSPITITPFLFKFVWICNQYVGQISSILTLLKLNVLIEKAQFRQKGLKVLET